MESRRGVGFISPPSDIATTPRVTPVSSPSSLWVIPAARRAARSIRPSRRRVSRCPSVSGRLPTTPVPLLRRLRGVRNIRCMVVSFCLPAHPPTPPAGIGGVDILSGTRLHIKKASSGPAHLGKLTGWDFRVGGRREGLERQRRCRWCCPPLSPQRRGKGIAGRGWWFWSLGRAAEYQRRPAMMLPPGVAPDRVVPPAAKSPVYLVGFSTHRRIKPFPGSRFAWFSPCRVHGAGKGEARSLEEANDLAASRLQGPRAEECSKSDVPVTAASDAGNTALGCLNLG